MADFKIKTKNQVEIYYTEICGEIFLTVESRNKSGTNCGTRAVRKACKAKAYNANG